MVSRKVRKRMQRGDERLVIERSFFTNRNRLEIACARAQFAENPGIHVEPSQSAEEEDPLSGRLPNVVFVVAPGQVITDVDPEEPEAADSPTVVPLME
ncbi:unnamed protein product [Pleuronectes platessa]|uniref:Uncharacterized protein n=1 Tax=Pleuronectes platessa TaxID=8262 RepID=A0A9N7VWJ6_PLEPL|nr:unnamed protein product [Pleuronectes platessa]